MIDGLFVADEPAFEHRAYMLDVSRDRVPTMATLRWLIGILGRLRFTELQLYVEHTFVYAGHDEVWRDASPLTVAEMGELATLCKSNDLGLVANMNAFGHMGRWLSHERYRPMAECPDRPEPPTCLAPTPENAAFAVSLAREMLAAVGSSRIHIGGDEPFELGEGWSAPLVAERGLGRVYLDHLNRIIEPLVADGREVLFWGDQFRQNPALMADIPAGAVGVVWTYEAPGDTSWESLLPAKLLARLGAPTDAHLGFEAHSRLFVESGQPFWVAPGTGTWNTFIGRNSNATANIIDAARVGTAHGAQGILLADWGDNGHWQPLTVSLPSLVRFADVAWNGAPVVGAPGPIIDELLDAAPGTGELIDRLGQLGETLGPTAVNASPVFTALIDTGMPTVGEVKPAALVAASKLISQARAHFDADSEMAAICAVAALGLNRLAGHEPSASDLEQAKQGQAQAWLTSSRPGGLNDSLAKLQPQLMGSGPDGT